MIYSKKYSNKYTSKGQVAVFLMLCIALFCTLLSIVVNSAIVTTQKIRLQNTADIAALGAADLQRRALNEINAHNRAIEAAWKLTQSNLLNLLYYCHGVPAITCQTSLSCTCGGCKTRDDRFQNIMTTYYKSAQRYHASRINKIIEDTNKEAHKLVLETVFKKTNVPFELYNVISEKETYPEDGKAIANSYDTKTINYSGKSIPLKSIYSLDDSEEMPLFPSYSEERPLIKPRWNYTRCQLTTAGCLTLDGPPSAPCAHIGNIRPDFDSVSVKILKTVYEGDSEPVETHYFVMLSYTPLRNFNIFNVRWRTDESDIMYKLGLVDMQGKRYGETGEKEDMLFLSRRSSIHAFSIARPEGGKVAADGTPPIRLQDYLNPFSRIQNIIENATATMDNYERNSLIGFADKGKTGVDLNKILFGYWDFKKEDLWH